jgi:hypothetical protein
LHEYLGAYHTTHRGWRYYSTTTTTTTTQESRLQQTTACHFRYLPAGSWFPTISFFPAAILVELRGSWSNDCYIPLLYLLLFLCIRLRDLMYLSTYYQIAGTVSSKNMQDLVHAPPSPSSHPHQSESRNDRGGLNFPRPNLTAEPGTI